MLGRAAGTALAAVLLVAIGLLGPVAGAADLEVQPEVVHDELDGLPTDTDADGEPRVERDELHEQRLDQLEADLRAQGEEPLESHGAAEGIVSEPVTAPMAFSLLGFAVPEGAGVSFRTREDGHDWGAWEAVHVHPDEGPDGDDVDADAPDGGARTDDEGRMVSLPAWTGAADELQIRVDGADPEDVGVHLVDGLGQNRDLGERLGDAVTALVRSVSGAGAPAHAADEPDIVSRSEWGAEDASSVSTADEARGAVIHHTVTGNDYDRDEAPAVVRSIQRFHQQGQGWRDIGYNFLVDRFGQVYEGREGGITEPVIGAHAAGHNTGSIGIAFLGQHHDDVSSPSFEEVEDPAIEAAGDLLTWLFDVHGINAQEPETLPSGYDYPGWASNIVGHGSLGSTSCPGSSVNDRLPDLREHVLEAQDDLGVPDPSDGEDGPDIDLDLAPEAAVRDDHQLTATLTEDGEPVADHPVLVSRSTMGEEISEEMTTDEDGRIDHEWSRSSSVDEDVAVCAPPDPDDDPDCGPGSSVEVQRVSWESQVDIDLDWEETVDFGDEHELAVTVTDQGERTYGWRLLVERASGGDGEGSTATDELMTGRDGEDRISWSASVPGREDVVVCAEEDRRKPSSCDEAPLREELTIDWVPDLSVEAEAPSVAEVGERAEVTATVTAQGQAISGWPVVLDDGSEAVAEAFTDDDGRVTLPWRHGELGAAEATVCADDDGSAPERCADADATSQAEVTWERAVGRLAGTARQSTAAEVSEHAYGDADWVVVASSDDYPDALSGAGLAGHLDAPVLLTSPSGLDQAAQEEIERLGADQAILLGGTAALSPAVADDLEGLGLRVSRAAGADRSATSATIARWLGEDHDEVIVANGRDGWPDAMAASQLAGADAIPILLVGEDHVPQATDDALADLDPDRITIVGGSAVVSDGVAAELGSHGSVQRLAGAERIATSLEVADAAVERGASDRQVWVASARNWPDALSAGPAVAEAGGILVLSEPDVLAPDSPVATRLGNPPYEVRLVGGDAALSSQVEDAVRDLVGE